MGLKGFDTTQSTISFGKCGKMNAITREAIGEWNKPQLYIKGITERLMSTLDNILV